MIAHIPEYDYLIINDDFDKALIDLKTIMSAGRLLQTRQCNRYATIISDFIKK